jgi:PAS domain S-box-containing protein
MNQPRGFGGGEITQVGAGQRERGLEQYALSIGLPMLCLFSLIWLDLKGPHESGLAELEVILLALAGAGGLLMQPVRTTALPRKTSQMSLLASHAGNAVLLTDANGRIEWVNEALTTLTGYSRAEALGRVVTALTEGPEKGRSPGGQAAEGKRDDTPFGAEVFQQTEEGYKFWAAVDVRPVRDEGGKLTHYITFETDVAARKKNELESRRQAALLQAVVETTRNLLTEPDFWAACDQSLRPIGQILQAERIQMVRDDQTGREIGLDISVPVRGRPWARIQIDGGAARPARARAEDSILRLLAEIIGGIALLKGVAISTSGTEVKGEARQAA